MLGVDKININLINFNKFFSGEEGIRFIEKYEQKIDSYPHSHSTVSPLVTSYIGAAHLI